MSDLPLLISFFVEGQPIPWRAPMVTRGGHAYSPDHVKKWKSDISVRAKEAMKGRGPHEGLVEVRMEFRRNPTKARPKEYYWGQRPDLVNLQKAAEDACNSIVYVDDNQIVSSQTRKIRGIPEGVEISVYIIS